MSLRAPEYEKNAKRFEGKPKNCAKCSKKMSRYNDDRYCNSCLENLKVDTSAKKKERRNIRGSFYLHRLVELKDKASLSYRDLEKATGVKWDTLRQYGVLRSRCNPTRAKLVADALGVSVEELAGE